MCGYCRKKLYEKSPDMYTIGMPDYSNFKLTMNTRANSEKACVCELCNIVRDQSAFNFSQESCTKINKKNAKTKKIPANYRCAECLSVIEQGKPHQCTKKQFLQILNLRDQKKKKQFASQVITEKLENQTDENKDLISLSRIHGKQMLVNLSKNKKEDAIVISAESVSILSTNFGLSSNTTLGVVRSLRTTTKKKKIV